ncbi:MAG: hypothetical protein PVI30_16780 [Myxococcales bacterium]
MLACSSPAAPHREKPGDAVLSGVVRLAEDAKLPAYRPDQLGWAKLLPGDLGDSGCGPAERAQRLPLGPRRELGGVVVAASGFRGAHVFEKRIHRVVRKGCKLTPATVSATHGDMLKVVNAGPGRVPLTFGPVAEPVSLAEGSERLIPLGPGVESLMCPLGVGCGRTDIVVFHHSLHAVTDARGRFEIRGFPEAQYVTVHAWHPLLAETGTRVWMEPGGSRTVDLTIAPRQGD